MHSNLEPQIAPEEVADLEVIDYQKLLALNASEQFRVAKACEDRGFFILRVEHAGYEEIWDQARKTFDVAKQAFGLPEEQKERFHMALSGTSELSGYKPLGYYAGIIEGRRDGFEQFRIPRIGILRLDSKFEYHHPELVNGNREILKGFMNTNQSIGITILSSISSALGVPDMERFEKSHGSNTLTNSMIAFNKHPKHNATDPDLGHNAHSDVGSIAILYAPQWGLQVFEPITKKWEFVRPLEGHLVVNVGDALRHMSHNRLRSSLHRVVPVPGTIEQEERYSLVYFLEPDNETTFSDPEGVEYSAQTWHDMKMASFTKSHEDMEASLQTGHVGILGTWESPI